MTILVGNVIDGFTDTGFRSARIKVGPNQYFAIEDKEDGTIEIREVSGSGVVIQPNAGNSVTLYSTHGR